MAENLDDGEFWLPPQFLTDDDTPTKLTPRNDDVFDAASRCSFPCGFNSPVESLVGSSETESSDEEERIAELTRLMSHELDLNRYFHSEKSNKGMVMTGSPQSTLCAFGCGKGYNLLHAAQTSPGVGFYTQQHQQHSLSHQQLQIAQFQMRREQQMAREQQRGYSGHYHYQQRQSIQMVPNRGRNSGVGAAEIGGGVGGVKVRSTCNMGLSSSAAWPPLQQAKQQHGCGVRAVFVGNPSGKGERNGTGVFLPRCVDAPAETRKKPTCSTVLVPARVRQALNKVEDMVGGQRQYHRTGFNGTSNIEYGPAFQRVRSNYGIFQQKRNNLRPQLPVNHEILLPQEWTY